MLLEQLQHCYVYPHLKSQNPKMSSNRLFSPFFTSLKCYREYSFLNSHCSSFSQYFNLFWPVYKVFFFPSFSLIFPKIFSLLTFFSLLFSVALPVLRFSPSVLRSSRHCLRVGIFTVSRGWVDGGVAVGLGADLDWRWLGFSGLGFSGGV